MDLTQAYSQKNLSLRPQESTYRVDQFLLRGVYALIVTAPFDTRIAVIPQNPPAGMQFFPDADPAPFIWNSRIQTPVNAQYSFIIRLDEPVIEGELQIQFILISTGPPPPPPVPPWPPVGGLQQVWDNPYYQAIIRRLHSSWIAEQNRRIKVTHGPSWYIDAWGRALNPPYIVPTGHPDGHGGGDPPAWCWFNLSGFREWIVQNGP